ncbi:MAG TPA: transcriptional repressor [Spirochaetia bacterium]|nr:MAG: hypothetical protein A2Y41_13150 [Spirochaetes bacterium GWB1_36_13]HCL57028.1 transcriptional repressor [Spirochaetia bacterium]
MKKVSAYQKEILEVLEKSGKPLTAKEIYEEMENRPDFSTVYRGLHHLENKEYIRSVTLFDHISLFFLKEKKHQHFIYCRNCKKIDCFDKCFAKEIEDSVQKNLNYRIFDHFFYFSGLCQKCAEL